jgi:aminoglycoside 6'-N-acetyltransferase I
VNLQIKELSSNYLEECVDLAIATFTKEPWNDVYESRDQVVTFYKNHLKNNYFLGYVALLEGKVVALSVGMKKPWIKGMEYYIDEFCVDYNLQGKGIGSLFLNSIADDIEKKGLNAIMLNTEKGYPSEAFYIKNGFTIEKELIILTR